MMNLAHAPHGGADGVNGFHYLGGEFLPFYVPRERMPQVQPNDYPELWRFLRERGVKTLPASFTNHVDPGYVKPRFVRPHQRISRAHALSLPPTAVDVPVLLSSDWYVLDGNHRWLAHVLANRMLPYYQLEAPFEQAIDLLLAFPKTYTSTKHLEV